MKIKKVEACRYSGDAEAAYVAEIVVVTVHTDTGVEGKGFASAPPGVGVLLKQIIENVLAPKVVDTDPQLTTELWDRMYYEAVPRRGGRVSCASASRRWTWRFGISRARWLIYLSQNCWAAGASLYRLTRIVLTICRQKL